MKVQITNREVDGVTVVTLEGRIVLGEESHSLREKLKSLLAEGKTKIVLNMAGIKYIDSSGLGLWSPRTTAPNLRAPLCAFAIWGRNSTKFCRSPSYSLSSMFMIQKQLQSTAFKGH